MKRITTVVVLALMIATSGFAGTGTGKNTNENVNWRVTESFKKEFSTATEVTWSRTSNLYKAQFTLNGQVMFAYLNDAGKLVGVYRNILSTQLPIQLMNELKNSYSDFWIIGLFEMATEEGTHYYITLQNADEQMVLKSVNAGEWSEYSRIKK